MKLNEEDLVQLSAVKNKLNDIKRREGISRANAALSAPEGIDYGVFVPVLSSEEKVYAAAIESTALFLSEEQELTLTDESHQEKLAFSLAFHRGPEGWQTMPLEQRRVAAHLLSLQHDTANTKLDALALMVRPSWQQLRSVNTLLQLLALIFYTIGLMLGLTLELSILNDKNEGA